MTTKEQRHYRSKAVTFKEDEDSDTEVEEFNLEPRKSDGREHQIIHSGHFMVSSLHIEHTPKKGYDFDTVNKQTCRTYHFGKTSTSHLSIDASLTKLFECMTLAYSGTLVSPKWKNFEGLKLLWRDKIRLNNAIWRAWYLQYVVKKENPTCHFVTPLDGSIETEDRCRPDAIYTEGKCWKQGIDIAREYHKWRTYFKKRVQKHKDEDLSSLLTGTEEQLSLFGDIAPEDQIGMWCSSRPPDTPVPMEMDSLFDIEVLMSESSDTLFSTLTSHQPMGWSNPREIAHTGNADMIQPGLNNLQPNLDFSLDSFDILQDLFHSLRQPTPPTSSPTSAAPPTASTAPQTQTSLLPTVTAVPKIPSMSMTNPIGEMRTCPSYTESYPPLFSTPLSPIPESVPTVPLAPPLPRSAPHSSLVQRPVATWNPTLGNHLPPSTVISSASPKPSPKLPQPPTYIPPRMPHKPRVDLAAGPVARPAFIPPVAGPFPIHGSAVLIAPNPLHTEAGSAVLIAPSPLHTEAPPPNNIVIAPGDITQGYRQTHISAEQKRRSSINLGFRTLCTLVPTLKTKPSTKPVTNATTLQKTVEYICKLQHERQQMQDEARCLREEIEELSASISSCQQKLPATGVPVTQNRLDSMWDKFNEYVKSRTRQNWKFWIFSIIIKPLFESFNSVVSTGSMLELRQTTLRWLEQHCSLLALRPMVLDALLQLSTTTSILSNPTRLPEEACGAMQPAQGHTGKS